MATRHLGGPVGMRHRGDHAPVESPSVKVVTVTEDGGFALDDAAIGAAVALALTLIALGATTAIRRRRIASPAT